MYINTLSVCLARNPYHGAVVGGNPDITSGIAILPSTVDATSLKASQSSDVWKSCLLAYTKFVLSTSNGNVLDACARFILQQGITRLRIPRPACLFVEKLHQITQHLLGIPVTQFFIFSPSHIGFEYR